MMLPVDRYEEALKPWRRVAQVYLWLSVGVSTLAAFAIGFLSQSENAKVIGAGFLIFAGLGAAFARALPSIQTARWWHWVFGAIMISPAILMTIN